MFDLSGGLIDEQNKKQLALGPRRSMSTSSFTSTPYVSRFQPTVPTTHVPEFTFLDKARVGDIKGITSSIHPIQAATNLISGIPHGMAYYHMLDNSGPANMLTHNTLPGMANLGRQQLAQQQVQKNYLTANPVKGIAGQIGEQLASAPLWMAGEGAIGGAGKLLSKLAPSIVPITERVGSRLPSIVKGGLKDVATYSSVVAPVQNIQQGGNLQSLLDLEKQTPGVLLGGIGVRGAGKLISKAITPVDHLGPLNQSLDEAVQNAYKSPTFRDAKTQQLGNTFADTNNNLGITGPTLPKQGMTSNELLQQNRLDAKNTFGRPPVTPNAESSFPQRIIPKKSQPLTWTNRDNIPSAGQLPIHSITPDNLTQLPKGELLSKNVQPITPNETMAAPIGEGRVAPGITPNDVVAAPIGNAKVVGAEPIIPAGLKERGVSENIRTDLNRPDALRDSYSADPLVYKQLGNKETLAKAQDIFNKGLEPAINDLDGLIKDLKPESAPLVKMIADQLTKDGNIVRARELMSNAANKATESGQFGQAFRILRDADPETFLMTFDKQLKKLNKEGLDQYGKNWKTVDLTPDELTMVGNIERGNQASYDSAFEQIQARIANEMPATAMEKINAWRHISMLLNPKTQIRNVGGNAIMMGMRKSAQSISGILQKVLPQADRTQSILVNKEYKQLAGDYFEVNKKDLLGGANKYQEGISLNMPNKRVFQNNALEKTRRFTYDLLQKGDNPFFQNAYIDRLASYAQAKGIKDFSKLDQVAFDTAKKEAEQATYKDASVIAEFVNKVKRTDKNASLGRKAGAILTEAALPFTKTPINIIKRGIQYSPIGIVNGLAGIKSSKGAAVAIDEMAKGLTGTGILGLGYLLASKGILTGKASSDPDLKAYDANTGNSPFSILGKYTYDWAQPFSVPLSVGVEIYNATKGNPKDAAKMNGVIANNDTPRLQQMALTAANGIMDGLNASGDTVFNMSIMKGIKTLLGSGTKGFMEGLAQLPQNYATQFIPTLSSQIAGTIDPFVRNSYVPGNLPASLKNTLISKIPFASKTLPPKQTPYGENMKNIENPLGRAFSQFLSPGIIAKNQGSVNPKIDTELRRLNESGLVNQFPTMVPNYIEKTQTHPKISLSPVETTQYQQRVGQLTLTAFDKLMKQGKYINAHQAKLKSPDEVKADLLATAISDSKALAKKEILKKKGLK